VKLKKLDLPHVHLVGGLNPSEKYQSVGMIIPKYEKTMKKIQTTNQSFLLQ
jgi:hypothetical protein